MAENTSDKPPKLPNQNLDPKQRQPQKRAAAPNTDRNSVRQTPDKMAEEIGTPHQKQSNRGQSGSNVGSSSPSEELDDDNPDVEEEDEEEDRITQRNPAQRDAPMKQ